MDFKLFIVVTGLLFIRPAEFNPALSGIPFYEMAILACLLASFSTVLAQFSTPALTSRPISAGVIGMMAAVLLSHLAHVSIEGAASHGFEFAKVVVYYLLLIGTVNTPGRLRRFLVWFAAFGTTVASLALLTYYEVIDLPSFAPLEVIDSDATGAEFMIRRLKGGDTSVLDDPNYLCLVLVASIMIGLYGLTSRRGVLRRGLWLAPLGVLGYAFVMTRSRGGFLMMAAGLLVLFFERYGWRKTVFLMGLGAPLALRFGGRQTDISTSSGTGQQRIQIWSDGLIAFFREPIFGIGQDQYEEKIFTTAHNSYLHCYTELGFFGGTIFLGMFLCAVVSLHRLNQGPGRVPDPELRRLIPFLMAAVVGWAMGIMTLSCSYIIPTYIILGLVAVFARVAPKGETPPLELDAALVGRLFLASVAFVAVLHSYVIFSVKYH